jgi:hypothetical protein
MQIEEEHVSPTTEQETDNPVIKTVPSKGTPDNIRQAAVPQT